MTPTRQTNRVAMAILLAAWAVASVGGETARAAVAVGPPAILDRHALIEHVLALADERLALMPSVAATKWVQGKPIADPERETAVIQAATDRAGALGLAPQPVAALFDLQVRLARELQASLHARWRRDGVKSTTPSASLAGELRPRLDRLTAEMLEAIYLAAPLLADAGPVSDYAELARARLPDDRWSEDDRTALLTTLWTIRGRGRATPERARAAGMLRIGTPGDYAPFSIAAEGRLGGVEVELAAHLAAGLGLRPVYIQSSWKGLMTDLAADHFDIAVGGISVTPARAAVAFFSKPIAHGGKTAVGRCADRDRFGTLEAIDRPGVRVIENAGGTNERFATAQLHRATLAVHPDNRTVFEELRVGRADVMFTDDTEIAFVTRRMPALCRLLNEVYDPADKAILMPADPAWRQAVDGWLAPELERGTPARLLEEYLGR